MVETNASKATLLTIILCAVNVAFSSTLGLHALSPKVIRVPIDYQTIQQALSASGSGDTIYVVSGLYNESIVVSKPLQLIGENRSTTLISGNGTGTVISIVSDNVVLSGFTIMNSDYGVNLQYAQNSCVQGNIFLNSSVGVSLRGGERNSVEFNDVTRNEAGIALYTSLKNIIRGNKIWNNSWHGISLWYSSQNNLVSTNHIWNNMNGVLLYSGCHSNEIIGNNIQNNSVQGIYFASSSSNTVEDNRLSNHEVGMRIRDSNANFLSRNIITESEEQGLIAEDSNDNSVYENIFFDNAVGLSLYISDNSTIFRNNFILNQRQAEQNWSMNTWNYEAQGNYWDDYHGTDVDKDGVGDTGIPHLGLDSFPLMVPWFSGDVNHDSLIEARDLAILEGSFGTSVAGQGWNPHADSNADGIVDIYDLIIIGINFGKKWQFQGGEFRAHVGSGGIYQK